MQRLAEGVLTQIASLLNVDCAGILVLRDERQQRRKLLGAGRLRLLQPVHRAAARCEPLDTDLQQLVRDAFERRRHEFLRDRSVLYIQTGSGREVVVLLEAAKDLSDTDRTLVEVFCSRLSVAFDNVILYEQLQDANARLEERVIAAHARADRRQPAAGGAMGAAAPRQRLQERDPRHGRPRPQEPARA